MPFINGRYHMNPTMGDALEAARAAEAALLALQQRAAGNSQDDADDAQNSSAPSADADAPIHRIEIDATEVVPNATGRAARGFVARVHRACAAPSASSDASCTIPPPSAAPESHVFTDHRDLLSFLQTALAGK
jgi:hypothetical protein